ncbi:MAG: metalloregulator ArsR/SmtB family transcription factor [Pseudomonadales bacterium]|nr:metalloregulator ArsR/SmtB family transcription factor [Pseudomonadales bacterium]
MHALDILGDPVRRRILELLTTGEQSSGEVVAVIAQEFAISQPAVSHQLKVLRESGFTSVRPEGQRRIYALSPGPITEVEQWLEPFRQFWDHKLGALATEIARGKKKQSKP